MDCKYAKIPDNSVVHHQQSNGKASLPMSVTTHINQKSIINQQVQQHFKSPILPIDDFYLLDNPNKYSDEERQLRIKLTAVYRLIELNGWSMGIYNHVTVSIATLFKP